MQQANYLQLFLNVGLRGPVIFLLHLPALLPYSRCTARSPTPSGHFPNVSFTMPHSPFSQSGKLQLCFQAHLRLTKPLSLSLSLTHVPE